MGIYWPYYFKKEQIITVLFEDKKGRAIADDGKNYLVMEMDQEAEGIAYWTVPKSLCQKVW